MSFSISPQLQSDSLVFQSEESNCGIKAVDIHSFTKKNWIAVCASISEINSSFAGTENKFLHNKEVAVFATIRAESYRQSWFAGRLLTKTLYVKHCLSEQTIKWKDIQIVSRDDLGRSIPPQLLVNGVDTCFVFSLSHVADKVIVVASTCPDIGIGCDLVYRGTATSGIVKTFFHDTEANDSQNFDTIWAVKEAAYKSCQTKESFRPRQWLTQQIGENRYFCHHLGLEQQLFAEVETLTMDDYTLAVARRPTVKQITDKYES